MLSVPLGVCSEVSGARVEGLGSGSALFPAGQEVRSQQGKTGKIQGKPRAPCFDTASNGTLDIFMGSVRTVGSFRFATAWVQGLGCWASSARVGSIRPAKEKHQHRRMNPHPSAYSYSEKSDTKVRAQVWALPIPQPVWVLELSP